MKQSIHVRQEHRNHNKWHCFRESLFPSASPTPHKTKRSKKETRKPHCWSVDIHRQKADYDSNNQSLNRSQVILDIPQNYQIDSQMKNIDMAETIYE